MKLTTPYNYPTYTRVDIDGKRHYAAEGYDPVPSVTTILSATKDTTPIDEWRDRIGHENADKIVDIAVSVGQQMHTNLENYILHDRDPSGTLMARHLAKLIIKKSFPNIDEVWGVEAGLITPGLYAGTADLLGVHLGQPAIMDFKNSINPKKKEYIESYFLQVAAYSLSHNFVYGTSIKKGVIMIACQTGVYQEFIIEADEMVHYQNLWLETVNEYYQIKMTK